MSVFLGRFHVIELFAPSGLHIHFAMPKVPFHLPNIPAPSDREKCGEKRSIVSEKAEILKAKNSLKFEIEANRERLAREEHDELTARRHRKLAFAITALDRLNPGDAHQNFHGISDISKTFDVPVNTLRRQYIEHRARAQDRLLLPAVAAEDPDRMLKALVDRCVAGGEATFTVYSKNEAELREIRCGKTAFYDIIARRKLDPLASLRLKRGRPELLTGVLVENIASNKSKDLSGNFIKNRHNFFNVLILSDLCLSVR